MVESLKVTKEMSEEEMSLAVDNICAILEDYDIEKVGNLLKENNWDESNTIQAYFAMKGEK